MFIFTKLFIIGIGIVQGQFIRISTTAAAIWQQIIRTPEILTMLIKNKHSKQKSREHASISI